MVTIVTYMGGMAFEARTPSEHGIRMDGAPEIGGADGGARPMEVVLAALGGCSGMDVVAILNKMRVTIDSFQMEVDGERKATDPKVYREIRCLYAITSPDALPEQVQRAVRLSQEKYCSVVAMLEKTAQMIVRIQLNGQEIPFDVVNGKSANK